MTSSDGTDMTLVVGSVLGACLALSIIFNVLLLIAIKRPSVIQIPGLHGKGENRTEKSNGEWYLMVILW